MKHAPIQIRNEAVVREIRELSALTGKPITDAVAEAVHLQLEREKGVKAAEIERKLKAVQAIVERFNSRPRIGPMLTDDDLYDEDGMPK
jgi:hypothetical protein